VGDGYNPTTPSACTPYGDSPDYTQPYPAGLNQLAYADGSVITTELQQSVPGFPHQALTNAPADLCPTNEPATPDWPPAPAAAVPAVFTVAAPAGVNVTIPGASQIEGTLFYLLTPGQTYTLSADQPSGCSSGCSCQQTFAIDSNGMGFTSSGNNCCALGTGGMTTTIGVGGTPYACTGP
jgi:hypothetical protein